MKTKPKVKATKVTGVHFRLAIVRDDGSKEVYAEIFPSPEAPTIKALLNVLVSSVNQECGTEFMVRQSKEQILKELGYY